MLDILTSQLLDPFRIGLIFFLLMTALRTRAAMGMAAPLAMGVVFIAILLTITTAATQPGSMPEKIGLGIVANLVILAVLLAGWTVWERSRRRG